MSYYPKVGPPSTDQSSLKYIINHVFLPLKLPQGNDHSLQNDSALSQAVVDTAIDFTDKLPSDKQLSWMSIIKMLQNFNDSTRFNALSRTEIETQIRAMHKTDVVVYMIRAQNAAVVMRKLESETIFESFEVSPDPAAVMGAKGKLICSYPGPAIAVPNAIVNDPNFVAELANFLVHMNQDVLDAAATRTKAKSTVLEERDTTHPRYITELLTGILRGLGSIANVHRIRKRIGDDVLWDSAKLPWRRSPLWLVIRVALQTTLERSALGQITYKSFILFFMTRLTKFALNDDLPNDTLHFMASKIARRLFKLGSSASPELSHSTNEVTVEVRGVLEERWKYVQVTQRASPYWDPETLRVEQDAHLSLKTSREYICDALKNRHLFALPTSFNFDPNQHRRGTIDDFLDPDASFLVAAYNAEPSLALADFETAIKLGIDDWTARVLSESADAESACILIEACAYAYSSRALKSYEGNPENMSVMFMTLLELWVALDKIVVGQIPLLANYSPEIPLILFKCLLLRKSSALNRFRILCAYLRARQTSSTLSAFPPVANDRSFAVRYFDQSPELKSLKTKIEADAEKEREKKKAELQDLNKKYKDLETQAKALSHEKTPNSRGKMCHVNKNRCGKCRLDKQMQQMYIKVHEWPLPASEVDAKAVVFELACPVAFDMWRSVTLHILIDICIPDSEAIWPVVPSVKLPNYVALWHYRQCHPKQRVTLASDAKPYAMCHYSKPKIPTSEDHVCVNNGLVFRSFDTTPNNWIANVTVSSHYDCSKLCTFILPNGPYNDLQRYLAETSHASNEVIANQADCHRDMTIHEFIAFGTLRSGPLLQWMNILRELHARTLNFRREEVHMLLSQAISQIGTLSTNGAPLWHQELDSMQFVTTLFAELESLLASVEGNWLEGISISTIVIIVCRAMSSTQEGSIRSRGYSLLRKIRTATFTLLIQLSTKLQANNDQVVKQELQGRVRDMAFTCRSTFDIDGDPSLVLTSDEDLKVFVYCAVMIYDNTPSQAGDLPQYSRLMLERDRRCCHALENVIREHTVLHRDGIDDAVAEIWGSYRRGTPWVALPAPNSRWLVSYTAASSSQSPQAVHFDLISGCLLVDGKQLGRLPPAIVQHSTYQMIFRNQILDIVPADMPGMDYAARGNINNYQVSFALRSDDLIIRAKHVDEDSPVLQLIPSNKFVDDLPTLLIAGHTHWLNLDTSEIEIRPVEMTWISSPDNWRLHFADSSSWLQKGKTTMLVDIRSQTWEMISNRVRPLEDPKHIMVTCDDTFSLKVDLPRYGLEFFVDEDGELQSCNMRNTVVDNIQSTGTMLGLNNQLVLCPKLQVADAYPHTVIIPDGRISYSADGHHVRITIVPEGPQATYHLFRVDSNLRCLTGKVGLTSKLYQAYLHALTSGCLPDPLTGRTGTEEALHILHSAACRSFMKLCVRDAELLRQISLLSTKRIWYPTHLRKMQTVTWSSPRLPTLSQHHAFYTAAKSIMKYGEQLSAFSEGSVAITSDLPSSIDHLLDRASIRASVLYPDQFSFLPQHGKVDVIYISRDIPDRKAEETVFNTAFMVHQRPSSLPLQQKISSWLDEWGTFEGATEPISLSYSKDWLHPILPDVFLPAYSQCRSATESQMFQLVFTLAAVAYGLQDKRTLIPTLLAFATVPEVRNLPKLPTFASYNLSDGLIPCDVVLDKLITSCAIDFDCSRERCLSAIDDESEEDLGKRRYLAFQEKRQTEKETILRKISDAWPCEEPPTLGTAKLSCYKLDELARKLRPVFRSCWANLLLKQHLDDLQEVLNRAYAARPPSRLPSQYHLNTHFNATASPLSSVDAQWLFSRQPPALCTPASSNILPIITRRGLMPPNPGHTARLQELVDNFRNRGSNKFHHRYADDLKNSISAFCQENITTAPDPPSYVTDWNFLFEHHYQNGMQFHESLTAVEMALAPSNHVESALHNAGLWPRVTPNFLFSHIASASGTPLGNAWRTALVRLSQALLQLQRSRRLLIFAANNSWVEFWKELENEECEGFDPESYADWLLIQLESQFLARPVQVKVALEMMSPSTGRNISLQLNMGEGKSYVIVPLVAAALSDGHTLVRVIVLKSLSAQMFQLLVERLSGLAQRRIFYVPFSRSLPVNSEKIRTYRNLMQDCVDTKGILVVQPDHILSFHLMAVDRQLTPGTVAAEEMLQVQQWLDDHTRDILDESDEILHIRYQLVYTVGVQKSLEGHPDRWTTTQQILTLVADYASRISDNFPSQSEVINGDCGTFPFIRILHTSAGEELIKWIAQDVITGAIENLSFDQASLKVKQAVYQFIVTEKVPEDYISLVEEHYKDTNAWNGLLVLRGLLACGILVYVLKERRFRVDYGLSPIRTMLAVPFRAKDMPSLRAEFGHPDVAVALTCLSYYYTGLTREQLLVCFDLLLKQDNPDLEYESWVFGLRSIPECLQHLNGINTESAEQLGDLLQLFAFNKAVVDFYLSRVVFPKEAKSFPHKLTCSGWDLAQAKKHLTTGFSGTNDNRYLLPNSIVQHELDYQRSTNARVLAFLLRPENNFYRCIPPEQKVEGFINELVAQSPEVRVLLDVGAQMLELKNQELAKAWLRANVDAKAAIFVNDDDELTVVDRNGKVERLVSSPFAQQLDECIVYLDDAHTRGTDVKLPANFRAVVTLGPKVTKDRLTQGCMRMRKLGNGHSVMFFAPIEVDRSIRAAAKKGDDILLDVVDILHWTMVETCKDIQMRASDWVQQGLDFKSRHSAWHQYSPSHSQTAAALKNAWLQLEERTLDHMYAPCGVEQLPKIVDADIRRKCEELGVLLDSERRMDEEQEREVIHEVERERQVERPLKVEPATHTLHADVRRFIKTGRIPKKSFAFVKALSSLATTTANFPEDQRWAQNILVTRDFAQTVSSVTKMNDFLRPVNWVVSSNIECSPVLVVMSPDEINKLLPDIRASKIVHLCVYTPRTTKMMQACDDLQLYCVPSTPQLTSLEPLILQLNLFAGQLYFSNFEMYLRTCNFLGINGPDLRDEDLMVDNDGFIKEKNRPAARVSCPFKHSQLVPLKELFGMRRKGMGYRPTHLGKMLNGRILTNGDFLD